MLNHSLFSFNENEPLKKIDEIIDINYHCIEFIQSDLARQLNEQTVQLDQEHNKAYWDFQNLLVGEEEFNSDQALEDPNVINDIFNYNALQPRVLKLLLEIYDKYYDVNKLDMSSFFYYISKMSGAGWKKQEKQKAMKIFEAKTKFWVNEMLPKAVHDNLFICYR